MPESLRAATGAAYLCLRAVDEVEDHPSLTTVDKRDILLTISHILLESTDPSILRVLLIDVFRPYTSVLPDVTLSLSDWVEILPTELRLDLLNHISTVTKNMALWCERSWIIIEERDLDDYSRSVGGDIGLLLTTIFHWHSPSHRPSRNDAIGFGMYLQAVNILRGRSDDAQRNVNFFPIGWEVSDMVEYAARHRCQAAAYLCAIKDRDVVEFCSLILEVSDEVLSQIKHGIQPKPDGINKP